MHSWIAFAALTLTGVAVASCTASPPAALSGNLGTSSDSAGVSLLAATTSDPNAQKNTTFNPLAPPRTVALGGREVIKNPTLADVRATGRIPDFSIGRADAPVTVIKYASLTCPYCRQFHKTVFPQLKRSLVDTGKVRFIIREFPIGRTSGNATIALRCAKPDKYLTLYGKFLDQQAKWVSQEVDLDRIYQVAQQVGMKRSEFDACLKNQGMIKDLQWVKDRGRKLGVIGTPNFFIQNTLYKKQLTMLEIRQAVDNALKAPASPSPALASSN